MRAKSGMTLIELVIVLALLAGLAGMALTTVGSMGSRARYDETTAQLRLIRAAVIGGDGQDVGRFLRDMGRLPIRHGSADGEELGELWRDMGAVGYGDVTDAIAWPDSPPPTGVPASITVRGGWNGPYLAVDDPATARLYDGFGNPFVLTTNAGHAIQSLTSLGSDGAAGGSEWDEMDRTLDLAALLPATSLRVTVMAASSTNAQQAVWRTVAIESGDEPYQVDSLRIGLFACAVSESARTVDQTITNDTPTAVFDDLAPTTVRVFAYSTGPDLISGMAPEWIDLRPGANAITLYLREP